MPHYVRARSSHFETPYDFECAIVKKDRTWMLEGEVFQIGMPDAQGNCAQGSAFYQFYNKGMSGCMPGSR